jgi:hypothetical protein
MVTTRRFAPEFKVEINGEPLPAAMRGCVTGISYENGLEGADRVELSLANPDLRWLDDPFLQMDNGFELSLGYTPDPLEKVFVGEITGVNANFPGGGMPTLTVVAHDFMQRMTTGSKTRAFAIDIPCLGVVPLPDPAVVSLVSVTDLLIPYPDPIGSALSFLTLVLTYIADPLEARKMVRVQDGESDFEFLSTIAKENGWDMYIDHTIDPQGYIIRFRFPVLDNDPSLVLKYGESLIDFTPRVTTVGQVVGVSTRIWIAAIQTELVLVLSWDYDRAAFDLMVYPGIGNLEMLMGSMAQSVLTIDAIGPATAPRKILGELLPRLNNRLTSRGSTVGDLRIRAGRVIELDGVGEQFGGKYRITTATHTIDSGGFRSSFEGRKEIWFGEFPRPKGIGGLFRIQGNTIR